MIAPTFASGSIVSTSTPHVWGDENGREKLILDKYSDDNGRKRNRDKGGRQRINEQLLSVTDGCLLIDADGKNVGIMPIKKALERARIDGYDLVEVGGSYEHPVCRLMDYAKYKYELGKKVKANRKNGVKETKQVKFGTKIQDGDLTHKMARAAKLLDNGHKVIITVTFRGREITHREIGEELLDKAGKLAEGHGRITSGPTMSGHEMSITISPSPTKNGNRKRKEEQKTQAVEDRA